MAGKMNEEKKKIKKDGMKKIERLGKCLKVPFRVFSLALDFYVRSITDCSGRARCGPSTAQLQGLPKNLSISSSKSTILYTEEDFRELMRAASTRSLKDNNKTLQLEVPRDCYGYCSNGGKIARSFTSGMGRIDEEKPCEFGEEVRVDVNINVLYPRSRSHAVSR